MTITVIIDKIENGSAYLLSQDMGLEICIPLDSIDNKYKEGEIISLTLDKNIKNGV